MSVGFLSSGKGVIESVSDARQSSDSCFPFIDASTHNDSETQQDPCGSIFFLWRAQ